VEVNGGLWLGSIRTGTVNVHGMRLIVVETSSLEHHGFLALGDVHQGGECAVTPFNISRYRSSAVFASPCRGSGYDAAAGPALALSPSNFLRDLELRSTP
jgi:hypothetical protein